MSILEVCPDTEQLEIKAKRRSPRGISTNNLILSAGIGTNADLFPSVLALHVSPGSVVADTTFGKGVFWKKVPVGDYILKATDLKSGVDARNLPYESNSLDCVVFDPPYMSGNGSTAHENHQNFEFYYQNSARYSLEKSNGTVKKYHDAVLDLYFKAADEAFRVLKTKGIYIVKCQDEVCANKQRLTHVEIINRLADRFEADDIFVLVRNGKPGVSVMLKQKHARKNHSYFLVFKKRK